MNFSALTRAPFAAGLAGGIVATAAAFTALAASGTLTLQAPELELEPRVRIWRMLGSDAGHWPRLPPGQPISAEPEELLVDTGRFALRFDGTRAFPFQFAVGPRTTDEDPPAVPRRSPGARPLQTTVDFPNNERAEFRMTDGAAEVAVSMYLDWQGVVLTGSLPGELRWPLRARSSTRPWTLVDLESRAARTVGPSTTAVTLEPYRTYLKVEDDGEVAVVRSARDTSIVVPRGGRPYLRLESGGAPVRAYVAETSLRLRTASADGRLPAGDAGRHLVLFTHRLPGRSDVRPLDLPAGAEQARTTGLKGPATLAIPWKPLIPAYRESGSGRLRDPARPR